MASAEKLHGRTESVNSSSGQCQIPADIAEKLNGSRVITETSADIDAACRDVLISLPEDSCSCYATIESVQFMFSSKWVFWLFGPSDPVVQIHLGRTSAQNVCMEI